jgi:hypothetical protein
MKNTNKLGFAILILALVFGFVAAFTLISCDNDTTHTCSFGEWTTKTEATCNAAKVEKRTCSCGKEETQNVGEPDPALHIWGGWTTPGDEDYPATCTTDGKGKQTCTNPSCGAENPNTTIPKLGHLGLTAPFAATCTEAGNSEYSGICTRDYCAQPVVTGTVIPKLGHETWNWTTYIPETGQVSCTRSGCSGGFAKIGDIGPGGGVIFYVADGGSAETPIAHTRPDGFKFYQNKDDATGITAYYLEAAPANALGGAGGTAATMMWRVGSTNALITTMTNITAAAIGSGTDAPTDDQMIAINDDIGMGRKNTDLIVAFYAGQEPTYRNAARAADTYTSTNGTSDWFLPSIGELYWLYQNRAHLDGKSGSGITGMGTSYFWSSSQVAIGSAWSQEFVSDGGRYTNPKNNTSYVRAVRAF